MNICIFDGFIGKDAETRYLPSGMAVTEWPMAVTSGYGERRETTWLRCKKFKAEGLAQYLTKGVKITVQGELSNREFEDREGNKRMSLELVVRDVVLPMKGKEQQPQDDSESPF